MRQRILWFATAAGLAVCEPALAQQPAKPEPAKPAGKSSGTVGEIVVEGAPPPVRVDAERKSYSLANDLQATTGSISDALRNVPSVEVDVQGVISLRGDPNVTIMIDGKPSGMFKGDGRAQALQSLPADQIERVEVITNPSAAYNPEGSGGIINLVTKKTAKPGVTGSLRANLGLEGRNNGGVSASYRSGRMTLSGDLSARRDKPAQTFTTLRTFADPAGPGMIEETRRHATAGKARGQSGRAGVDFDVDDKTRLSGYVRFQTFQFDYAGLERLDRVTDAGALRSIVGVDVGFNQNRATLENTLSFSHKFGQDHELSATFTRELTDEDRGRPRLYANVLPAGAPSYENADIRDQARRTQLKVDYTRPLDQRKLKLGYEFNGDDNDYGLTLARGPVSGPLAVDATRSNLFRFEQQVHAVYGTYEAPIGKVTALAGLRLESTQIDLDQVTRGQTDENDYVRLYPSLHLGYPLDDQQQLSASYSRRVQRPQPAEYNAFPIYFDPQNLYAGNPQLKPQVTDAFELGYQYRKAGTMYLATAFYRHGQDSLTDVYRDLGGGVILQTRENVGSFQSAGLDLSANGRLPAKLSYSLSANLYWSEIDASDLGFGSRRRSGYTAGGRATLNWQATDDDFLQIQGFMIGERLLAQGSASPQGLINLGYRHKFSDKLSGVVTAQDVLKTSRFKGVIDTPVYSQRIVGYPRSRTVFVGLTYSFGGGKPRDQGFDFGSGSP